MKSHLSQILPVSEACFILEEDTVRRTVRSFLVARNPRQIPSESDVELLVKALMFDVEDQGGLGPGPGGTHEVPASIQNTWAKLTKRSLGLDKLGFIKWSVPACFAPFQGPGGHMGLFDCWVHALSSAANNYSTSAGGGGPGSSVAPVILLPDILITVAVCREYRDAQRETLDDPDEDKKRWDYAIMMMSLLAYRVYDSYQKKGVVTRDTIHRFLSDVHGEDSYKTGATRITLDRLFSAPPDDDGGLDRAIPSLTASQFASGMMATRIGKSHVLLDWISVFGSIIIPTDAIPQSTQAYLETLSQTYRSMEELCQQYGLASLFEIKRRFHSLVETSQVVHGDVLKDAGDEEGAPKPKPRHVISQKAFVQAASADSEELGNGGYLPTRLAELTFQGVCPVAEEREDGTKPEGFWSLYDVLSFGCDAVRLQTGKNKGDIIAEIPLLRFAFKVFGLVGRHKTVAPEKRRPLVRMQVGEMLLLLLEHGAYRLKRDSKPPEEDDEESFSTGPFRRPATSSEGGGAGGREKKLAELEQTQVHIAAASLLALLPPDLEVESRGGGGGGGGGGGSDQEIYVPLRVLIDYVLELANSEDGMLSFDGFCRWHYHNGSTHLPATQRRVGPFLVDLRLVASILFGIPPTKASTEMMLIEEIQKRHKYRYPQTDVARRGPRGTVWYILDDRWFRHWVAYIQTNANSDTDAADGRDKLGGNVRGLGKINNTGLLAENGSLALRPDIRWRQDYEIVPPLVWSALQAWYDGGPPVHRMVVRYIPTTGPTSPHSRSPRVRTEYEIELYPLFLTIFLCDASSRGEVRPFQQSHPVSRVSPVRVLLVQLCKGLDVDPKYGRLWMMESDPEGAEAASQTGGDDWLLGLDESIVEQRNRRGSSSDLKVSIRLLLELKDEESGKWPRGLDGRSLSFKEKKKEGAILGEESTVGDGIVGIYNMGNTCYLSSSIQCLSHTPIFRDYFTSKAYVNDINTTNPIGHQGRLAQVSAVLINALWKRFSHPAPQPKRITAPGSYAPVHAPAITPKTFKDSLGKFSEHFAGNEQHDAQELLAFLLGGLSEDLNRIVEKPYIEAPDSDGRPDVELADIWWSNHLKREMSIIVALFTGQYKSLLTCRTCKYESARFEPFSFLQLPLPEDDQVSVSLIFYPISAMSETLKYAVRVKHDGKLADVLIALAKVIYADQMAAERTPEAAPATADRVDGGIGSSSSGAAAEEEDNEKKEQLANIYQELAKNMAVVDMRDGFIFKIAPNTWALPDLQNKETGELPLLHVYELDPITSRNPVTNSTRQAKKQNGRQNQVQVDDEEEEDDDEDDEDDEDYEDEEDDEDEEEYEDDEDEEDEEEDEEDEEEDDEDEEDEGEGEVSEDVKPNKKQHQYKVKSVDEDEDDPLEDEETKKGANLKETVGAKTSFLAFAQRKTEFSSKEGLHPFTHRVFGTPMLLRVNDLEGYTGIDLYDLAADRLRTFVPKSALRFLEGTGGGESGEEPHDRYVGEGSARSKRGSYKGGSRQRRRRTLSEMEDVAAGPVPRYGFRLRIASRDGRRCALCPWYQCCIGCLVPDDDYPTIVMCGDSVVVDWHFAVDIATNGFGQRQNQQDQPVPQSPFRQRSIATVNIKNHASCNDEAKKKGYGGVITLEDCLDAFASEERIPEAYCSKCKDFRVQTKRMSLWRLPPIVIIHLKRFQFTQHMRRKLRDLVVFPVEGLDLSRIMAHDEVGIADPVATSMNHGSSKLPPTNGGTSQPKAEKYVEGGNGSYPSPAGDTDELTTTTVEEDTPESEYSGSKSEVDRNDGDNNDDDISPLGPSQHAGRSVMLYDLYAVVHHQGALSGGHYVASLRSEDGQWRLFNDAQVYEIHSRDVVDASAYILFYIRRDVKDAKLTDFWDTRAREGEGLSEEEAEKLFKSRSDRCVIS